MKKKKIVDSKIVDLMKFNSSVQISPLSFLSCERSVTYIVFSQQTNHIC